MIQETTKVRQSLEVACSSPVDLHRQHGRGRSSHNDVMKEQLTRTGNAVWFQDEFHSSVSDCLIVNVDQE